ncbi:MAG: sigma-54-dependent Fis family transcriptional regulator [Alphaproteobacteria bacterium]|nr:sigma-54-dependent Fis family transcriptional regulator [Alphaproteobacteria bacterium]|tara:strand:+ start:14946 stop:16346 length:1401 start_codon:yes stop_codon:yes gene_type:complete
MASDILIVDDEADIRELVSGILVDEGYEARVASDSSSALGEISQRLPSLLVLDIWLQGSEVDGLELLDIVLADHPELPVVMISGHGNIETAVSAIKRGAYDYIEKPFKTDRLITIVSRAIETARLRWENQELRVRTWHETDLIGDSSEIEGLRAAIDKVAPTGARALITGPSGSGKEVAARLLHERSNRANGPFVVLNAASMSPERVEVELFGVEEGTEAPDQRRKVGTLEHAHGGTLFIDEVADMPLETQAKILRVLQEQRFERVGGTTRIQVDVRVVSASTRDLMAEIAAGRFREDLYHRLNVVPIRVPALNDRRDDVPILARYFLQRIAAASGLSPCEISEDSLAVLQAYDWPGNVRELRNLIERLLIMVPDRSERIIRVDELPPEYTGGSPSAITFNGREEIMTLPLREAREVFEREYLVAQITRFGGNISRTAGFVGMERSALHRKLKSLGLSGNGTTRAA